VTFFSRKRMWLAVIVGVAALGITVVAFLERTSRMHELTELAQLKERFNQDQGSVRIVLLLSPT
jgi:hypothetical protein